MADIAEIMDMIDWHMPSEIRIKGVSLARDTETIIPFIQPLTPEHNKNVWEGCAVIVGIICIFDSVSLVESRLKS